MSDQGAKEKKKRIIPRKSLVQSLRVAQAIQDNNAGAPYDRLDLAKALNYSPTSGTFRALITASSQFGLTKGSYNAKKIQLTERGKSAVAPRNIEEKSQTLREALLSIDIFKEFFEKFDDNRLPEVNFVENTLARDFGILSSEVKICYKMIIENATELGMLENIGGNTYVRLNKLSMGITKQDDSEPDSIEPEIVNDDDTKVPKPPSTPPPVIEENLKVFVSHGKNRKIMEAICEILEFGGFEPVVAVKEETAAVPVPEKIMESMRKCRFGVMNLSYDAREKREDGSIGVNQNVLIEVGSAFVLYNKQIILITDRRVSIPSNLQGLYRCQYEGEEMDYKTTMKLLKALNDFKKAI